MIYVLLEKGQFRGAFENVNNALDHLKSLHPNCVVNINDVGNIDVISETGDLVTSYESAMTPIQ